MGVPTLGDALSMFRSVGERVAFHDGDPLVGVGQHPGGEQPGQACPKDDRVVSDPRHLAPPVSSRCFDVRSEGIGRLRENRPVRGSAAWVVLRCRRADSRSNSSA
jgi:hypothetical protein